jgi:carbamoyl-phosphate synthase large subunit
MVAGAVPGRPLRVLIAGIGGASLGTEIFKSLRLAPERYDVFGCDISRHAYGHYQEGFARTFLADPRRYEESVLEICGEAGIDVVIPGADEPLRLLARVADRLRGQGVRFAGNDPGVVTTFMDKALTFSWLREHGFGTPRTASADAPGAASGLPCPVVVKPSRESGGSSFVFLAATPGEAEVYCAYLRSLNKAPILQEYLPVDEGEFTVGVLSLPDGSCAGSIALRRVFDARLSIAFKSATGLISSGNSQGLIDDFPVPRATAERIAAACHSRGPLNVQGRMRNGEFIPFEINPRFSASTHLRSLAGFNEVDLYLQNLFFGTLPKGPPRIRPGYYLRSFAETYVAPEAVVPARADRPSPGEPAR